jgi:hypothetical protein
MKALQQNINCGTQSYLLNDKSSLTGNCNETFGNRENTYRLLRCDIFNFKLEQSGRNLNFCHIANYFAK